MRDEAEKRIGHHYPKATLPDGSKATVIAWIWARTVTCPNPACGIEMPLVAVVVARQEEGQGGVRRPDRRRPRRPNSPSGHDRAMTGARHRQTDGTVGRNGASVHLLWDCGRAQIHSVQKARAGRLGAQLHGSRCRGQPAADVPRTRPEHAGRSRRAERPDGAPDGAIPAQRTRDFDVQAYGFDEYVDLFTNRQLMALTTFSDLVSESVSGASRRGRSWRQSRVAVCRIGGTDAAAYADAVATYLGLAVSRLHDLNNTLVTWSNSRDQARNLSRGRHSHAGISQKYRRLQGGW